MIVNFNATHQNHDLNRKSEPDEPERLCVFCKFHMFRGTEHYCILRPKVSPVTGHKSFGFCDIERGSSLLGDCGPEGKLFEVK